jgi:hypothetical protein
VEETQNHAGISFVNGQLMGATVLDNTNHGPVKFTGCGFWGIEDTDSLVYNKSSGRTSFVNCQFYWWDRKNAADPAILSQNGDLTVMGCEFGEYGKLDIFLSNRVRSAVITGNTFRTKRGVINRSEGWVTVKTNIVSYPPNKTPRRPGRKKLKPKIKEWNR